MMQVQQSLFSFSLLLLVLLPCPKILAQSPAAAPAQVPPLAPAKMPPAPPAQSPSGAKVPKSSGPINVVDILEKAKGFSVFVRLLKSTTTNTELNKELNNTNNGITILAPSDGAFSSLKAGTLNTLSDEDKAELVKFHIIPHFIASSQFQTESNPIRTQAGTGGRVSLNVTMTGPSVNISTGLTNTSISGTVYTDNQLAIYQVDKVLLPLDIFTTKHPAPAPAPALEKPTKKKAPEAETPDSTPKDASDAVDLILHNSAVVLAVGMVVAMFSL